MDNNKSGPYRDLFIYYLEGAIPREEESVFGHRFIGAWIEDGHSFLFFSEPADEIINRFFLLRKDCRLLDTYHFTYEQWQGGTLGGVRVPPFMIVPPWSSRPDGEEGLIPIELDPGVVFGNGLHSTTRHCLKAIAFSAHSRPLEKVIDFGTGTGLLAIAAAKMGAEHVLALDLNPLCVKTAFRNVALNGLTNIIHVVEGNAKDHKNEKGSLIIANMHAEVLEELLSKRIFDKDDRVILSGLMRTPFQRIMGALGRLEFHIIGEWDFEMTWFTLLAEKK
jgi:ribosomal protein L11 methyltransferase